MTTIINQSQPSIVTLSAKTSIPRSMFSNFANVELSIDDLNKILQTGTLIVPSMTVTDLTVEAITITTPIAASSLGDLTVDGNILQLSTTAGSTYISMHSNFIFDPASVNDSIFQVTNYDLVDISSNKAMTITSPDSLTLTSNNLIFVSPNVLFNPIECFAISDNKKIALDGTCPNPLHYIMHDTTNTEILINSSDVRLKVTDTVNIESITALSPLLVMKNDNLASGTQTQNKIYLYKVETAVAADTAIIETQELEPLSDQAFRIEFLGRYTEGTTTKSYVSVFFGWAERTATTVNISCGSTIFKDQTTWTIEAAPDATNTKMKFTFTSEAAATSITKWVMRMEYINLF
jgi:hypothetical protein